MTCELTAEDIAKATRAKSDQLNADDLCGGPITGVITGIKKGPQDQPVHIMLSCWHVAWKPCLTERRVMSGMWGGEPKNWLGKTIRLKRDPKALWANEAVGGVRIDGASGITGEYRVVLAVSKGKKAPRVVVPIAAAEPVQTVPLIVLPKWAEQGNEPLTMEQAEEVEAIVKAAGVPIERVAEVHGQSSSWSTETVRQIVGRMQAAAAAKRGGAK